MTTLEEFFKNVNYQKDIAPHISNPCFLFRESVIEENYNSIVESFGRYYPKLEVEYSVKTNLELDLLKIIQQLGAKAEIVCEQEYDISLLAGFKPSDIRYDGPYKPIQVLKRVIQDDIGAIYIDSWDDLRRINAAAEELDKSVHVGIRVTQTPNNPSADPESSMMYKFGVPIGECMDMAKEINKYPLLSLSSISSHIGTQNKNVKIYTKAINDLVDLADNISGLGNTITSINIGGGYPLKSLQKLSPLVFILNVFNIQYNPVGQSVTTMGEIISEYYKTKIEKSKYLSKHSPALLIQPGRSLIGNAGIIISKVAAIKNNWLFLNVGTSILPESMFVTGRSILPLEMSRNSGSYTETYNVSGTGLYATDNFAYNMKFPKVKIDDEIAIMDAGAYSIACSNRFTSLNPPVYLLKKERELVQIRRQETFEDLIAPTLGHPVIH